MPTLSKHHLRLTNKKLLAKNTLWNLLGQAIPALVAVVSVPIIIHQLGNDRFGILTLAWTLIGYFSLFDFGLGRAVTQMVSRKLGAGKPKDLPRLVWTALALLGGFGFLGAVVAAILSPLLVKKALHIPMMLQEEALACFYIMALSIPLISVSNIFTGMLEAKQKFNFINLVRVPLGVANYLLPLAVIPFSVKTYWLVATLFLTRLLGTFFYLSACLKEFPALRRERLFDLKMVKPLLGFGGWMTISNIISPLMVSLDRFLIAAVINLSVVAYYVTPYELATKLSIFSGPLVRVLFPAFSISHHSDRKHSANLLTESLKMLFALLFPLVLVMVIFSKGILTLWLGADFGLHSEKILQLISIGVLVNILAQILYAYVQGAGRPDLTTKNHLVELPVYLAVLFFSMKLFGVDGAAAAWTFRMILDGGLLAWQAYLLAFGKEKALPGRVVWMVLVISSLFLFLFIPLPLAFGIPAAVLLLTAFSFFVWRYFFHRQEKQLFFKLWNLVLVRLRSK